MNTTDDRDRSIDSLLRQSFKESRGGVAPGSSCPDAETLAAWEQGTLNASSLTAVEAHLSECAKCQEVVAVLARAPLPAGEPTAAWWQRVVDLRWLVPLAAAATAVAIWVAVPNPEAPQQSTVGGQQSAVGSRQSTVGGQQSAVDSRQSAVESQPSVTARPAAPQERADRAGAAAAAGVPAVAGIEEKALQNEKERTDAAKNQLDALKKDETPRTPSANLGRLAEPASAPQAAGAPAASALRAQAASEARAEAFAPARQANVIAQEIVSPTPLSRWRIGPRGLLQYSASGGASWEQLSTDVVADLVAGASPSSTVCWVVGRSGTVLLTVDGRRFGRLAFPVSADLTGVIATDARSASVTTSDGRTFRTTDGGATWTP